MLDLHVIMRQVLEVILCLLCKYNLNIQKVVLSIQKLDTSILLIWQDHKEQNKLMDKDLNKVVVLISHYMY